MTSSDIATGLQQELAGFIGTENWYRHQLNPRVTYTDGVKFFAARVGAYWLLDILATEPAILHQQDGTKGHFADVKLYVEGSKARLVVTDGNSDDAVFTSAIDYTDCPPGTWHFFMVDNVILLPSEY